MLVIRAHKRFAVYRAARLRKPGGRDVEGRLIELSLDGCRISKIDEGQFRVDETLTVRIDGWDALEARVRWLGEGVLGMRFVQPLHIAALDRLIRTCRGELACAGEPARRPG